MSLQQSCKRNILKVFKYRFCKIFKIQNLNSKLNKEFTSIKVQIQFTLN